MIPFDAYIRNSTEVLPQLGYLRAVATLYKTGDIEPGTNALNGEVASGSILRSIGRIWGINLAGSVTTSQCSGPISPVSAVPVDLGEWSVSDFTEPGATSEARRFTITLSDCIADPRTGGTITTAHIHLQPTGGSTTLDAEQGLLSLGDGSTATGLGIQMLMADGLTTVKLDREVSLRAIEPTGSTVLPFSARFVKQGERVTPGTAKGALGFTISYK
jgi:type 1 fimbria pilin